MDFEAVIEGPALCAALAQLQRHAGSRPLAALWRCDPDGITIEWGGVRHRIGVEGVGSIVVRVSGSGMRGLAKAPVKDPELRLAIADGELRLGRRRLTCHPVTADIADLLLPVGAGDTEFLKLHFQEPVEVLEQSGLHTEVAKRVDRVERALDVFGERMAWTGIDRERVRQLVWEELARIYDGEFTAVDAPELPPTQSAAQMDLLGNSDLPLFLGGASHGK